MAIKQVPWPEGWSVQMFNRALLAVRQHKVPDFAADVSTPPDTVREVVAAVEVLSEACGFYIFDNHTHVDPWQPAPHVPRTVLESIERIYVREYQNPERVLQLSEAGQDKELLLTRACRDCSDIIVITVGMAAQVIKRYNLQGKQYLPPYTCPDCKERRRKSSELRATLGARVAASKKTKPKKQVAAP